MASKKVKVTLQNHFSLTRLILTTLWGTHNASLSRRKIRKKSSEPGNVKQVLEMLGILKYFLHSILGFINFGLRKLFSNDTCKICWFLIKKSHLDHLLMTFTKNGLSLFIIFLSVSLKIYLLLLGGVLANSCYKTFGKIPQNS